MQLEDVRSAEAGRVVMAAQGYAAFEPSPMPPPNLAYDAPLVMALSRANTALSELAVLGCMLPNPYLMIAPYLRREAVLSSRIEGTRTKLSKLLLDEALGASHSALLGQTVEQVDDLRQVRNYIRALESGIARLSELPLSLRLVRELHDRLMQGVRGNFATPWQFRRSQNWIGPAGSTGRRAIHSFLSR